MGDEVRHLRTSCHASIRAKVSGGVEDWVLETPQTEIQISYHTVRQKGSSRTPIITSSKFVTYTQFS